MERVKIYGDVYLVGVHKDKNDFLQDVRKKYNEEGWNGKITLENIEKGTHYGNFDDNWLPNHFEGIGHIDPGLIKKYGKSCSCFYVNMEDIEE